MYNEKWAAEFKWVKDDGQSSSPTDATVDENVKVVHILVMCGSRQDLRSITSEVGIRFGAVQSILNDILGMSRGFIKMGAANVDR